MAWTFYRGATPAQMLKLRGCSRELLALGINQALALERLFDSHEVQRQADGAHRQKLAAGETVAWDRARGLRDQVADALRAAAGHDKEHRAQVEQAIGTANSGEALARGLEALVRLLRSWLDESAGQGPAARALRARLALFALDPAYADELAAASAALRNKSAQARNRPQASRISQAQIDRFDGVNLLLLGRVVRAFEHAHALDPSIPRLSPIATRLILARPARLRKQKESPPLPPPGAP